MKRCMAFTLGTVILLLLLSTEQIAAQVVVKDTVKITQIPSGGNRPYIKRGKEALAVQNGVISGFVMPRGGLLQVYYSFAERLDWYLPPWVSLIAIFNGDSAVADSILPRFPDVTISPFTFFNGCFATFEQHDRIFFQNFSASEEVYLYNVGHVEQGDTVQFFYATKMVYIGTRDTLAIFSADEVRDANGNLVGWN